LRCMGGVCEEAMNKEFKNRLAALGAGKGATM
jgi:hypothetical protein